MQQNVSLADGYCVCCQRGISTLLAPESLPNASPDGECIRYFCETSPELMDGIPLAGEKNAAAAEKVLRPSSSPCPSPVSLSSLPPPPCAFSPLHPHTHPHLLGLSHSANATRCNLRSGTSVRDYT